MDARLLTRTDLPGATCLQTRAGRRQSVLASDALVLPAPRAVRVLAEKSMVDVADEEQDRKFANVR